MTSYVFLMIITIVIIFFSIILYVANNRYQKLSKKEKQNLEKSLKKMGFFVLIVLLIMIALPVAGSTNSDIPDPTSGYPVLVPMDTAFKAESSIENIIYNTFALSEENLWRANTKIFIDNNTFIFVNNTSTIF